MKQDPKTRKRTFATIVYEESAPSDWRQIISNSHVPYFISPYHDKDKYDDGTPKKPHWHVMLMFDGVKSNLQWEELRDKFGGVGNEEISSTRGYARYLCHLDEDPKIKFHYDPADVIEGNGADYFETIKKNSDRNRLIREMVKFVRDNHITNYTDLFDYAMDTEPEWFQSLCDNSSYVINTYISDYRLQLRYYR